MFAIVNNAIRFHDIAHEIILHLSSRDFGLGIGLYFSTLPGNHIHYFVGRFGFYL